MQTSVIVESLGTVRLIVDVMSDLLQVLEVRPEYMITLFFVLSHWSFLEKNHKPCKFDYIKYILILRVININK